MYAGEIQPHCISLTLPVINQKKRSGMLWQGGVGLEFLFLASLRKPQSLAKANDDRAWNFVGLEKRIIVCWLSGANLLSSARCSYLWRTANFLSLKCTWSRGNLPNGRGRVSILAYNVFKLVRKGWIYLLGFVLSNVAALSTFRYQEDRLPWKSYTHPHTYTSVRFVSLNFEIFGNPSIYRSTVISFYYQLWKIRWCAPHLYF